MLYKISVAIPNLAFSSYGSAAVVVIHTMLQNYHEGSSTAPHRRGGRVEVAVAKISLAVAVAVAVAIVVAVAIAVAVA